MRETDNANDRTEHTGTNKDNYRKGTDKRVRDTDLAKKSDTHRQRNTQITRETYRK